MSKLKPIAELMKKLLEDKFDIEAIYKTEESLDWMPNTPNKESYGSFWREIDYVYSGLYEDEWTLSDRLSSTNEKINTRNARADIWFEAPYNFILEFDEKQHFNQFRLLTLERGYTTIKTSFDFSSYLNTCAVNTINPGTSGFTKLKSKDVLFPEVLSGKKQDNRIRQRAFRDYLKDIVPIRLGYNTTVRVGYNLIESRKDFTDEDINKIKDYIIKNNILDNIEIQE